MKDFGVSLDTSKVSPRSEDWGVYDIRRRDERPKATKPFDFTQGHELVEWQMAF